MVSNAGVPIRSLLVSTRFLPAIVICRVQAKVCPWKISSSLSAVNLLPVLSKRYLWRWKSNFSLLSEWREASEHDPHPDHDPNDAPGSYRFLVFLLWLCGGRNLRLSTCTHRAELLPLKHDSSVVPVTLRRLPVRCRRIWVSCRVSLLKKYHVDGPCPVTEYNVSIFWTALQQNLFLISSF
jgi:hypothetical protein